MEKMKKALLFFLIVLSTSVLFAQEKSKFRVGVDLNINNTIFQIMKKHDFNYSLDKSYTLSLNYNLNNNMNVGIKYINSYLKPFDDPSKLYTNGMPPEYIDGSSLFLIYNYFYQKKNWSVTPFIEVGAGYFSFLNTIYYHSYPSGNTQHSITGEFSRYKFAELVSSGIEIDNFRLSLEYFFTLPLTTIKIQEGSYNMSSGGTYSGYSRELFLNSLSFKIGYYFNL
jgi:hypothetical protein